MGGDGQGQEAPNRGTDDPSRGPRSRDRAVSFLDLRVPRRAPYWKSPASKESHDRTRREPQHGPGRTARPHRTSADRRVVAGRELPLRRADLPHGQPTAARGPAAGARKAATTGTLGHHTRAELRLRPPQPGDHRARPEHDVHDRARSRGPGPGRRGVAGRHATARSTPTSGTTRTVMRRLFTQFSFPGGIPSHVAPETPGSIHEGGELGYALSHAYGAAFDNPDLVVAAIVGDGEAETGPLAASWHSNKFLDPRRDGAVLPILHLNGYKIANPTVLARIPEDELLALMRGYGYTPYVVAGLGPRVDAPGVRGDARPLPRRDRATSSAEARDGRRHAGAATSWPMIVLRIPEGLDRPEGDRRQAGSRATGAPTRCRSPTPASNDGAPGGARGLAAQLPARGAVRRRRRPGARDPRPAAGRRPPDEREPARQRRRAAARPADARLPRATPSRSNRPAPELSRPPGCSARFLRDVMAREHGQLPDVRAGREQLQPAAGRPRGHRTARGTPRPRRTTTTSPSTAG